MCNTASIPNVFVEDGIASDYIVFVTADLSKEVFTWSSACIGSSVGNRPLAGQLNINPNFLNITQTPIEDPIGFWNQLSVILHEMTHLLGFSSSLYPYYIGSPNVIRSITLRGVNTTIVILPSIVQKARAYFNCSFLLGLELENQDYEDVYKISSHWERRIVGPEIMTSTFLNNPIYSLFTLGMLEATGWYSVNYSFAQPLQWGANKGCDFINDYCINSTFQASFPEFCSNLNVYGCTHDHTSKALCSSELGFPLEIWNYFDNNTQSIDPYSDNCPYFISLFHGDCRVKSNGNNPNILFDEYYGEDSYCFAGTFTKIEYSKYYDMSNQRGGCFKTQCKILGNASNYTLDIFIGDNIVNCPQNGGAMIIPNYLGYIICPDIESFCLSYPICPNQCSNNGYCINGKCQCFVGFTGKDCSKIQCVGNCNENGYFDEITNKSICMEGWTGRDCTTPLLVVNCTRCYQILDCYQGTCDCYPYPGRNCVKNPIIFQNLIHH